MAVMGSQVINDGSAGRSLLAMVVVMLMGNISCMKGDGVDYESVLTGLVSLVSSRYSGRVSTCYHQSEDNNFIWKID